jgi:hypothetical protein
MQSLLELIWRDSQTSNARDDFWRPTAKRLKILKWDREHRAYYPVEIDVYNNRKENEDYVG